MPSPAGMQKLRQLLESDTQTSQEDTVVPSEDVEVSEAETGDVTPAGDTTPEADVPEEE